VRNIMGVPNLVVSIGTDGGAHESTFPMPQALGKLVLAHVSVLGGVLDVVVNGNPAVVSAALPGTALASGAAPTVGAASGGASPASFLGIAGVGYFAGPGDAVIAEFNLISSRGIYDLADLFSQSNGPSWTHWYTARRGLVVAGAQAEFVGPVLNQLPLGAPLWEPGASNGIVPDTQQRVPLTRQGGSTTGGTVFVNDNPLWMPATLDSGGGGADARVFSLDFVDADLVGGVLSINHNLGDTRIARVSVRDNTGEAIGGPDSDTVIDADNVDVDLSSFQPLTGTWTATVVGA
jgi:hypothetical protein